MHIFFFFYAQIGAWKLMSVFFIVLNNRSYRTMMILNLVLEDKSSWNNWFS